MGMDGGDSTQGGEEALVISRLRPWLLLALILVLLYLFFRWCACRPLVMHVLPQQDIEAGERQWEDDGETPAP
jgi:hypothetical protein